jgi:glycosyltransferase involved in cell wall biosynthesis
MAAKPIQLSSPSSELELSIVIPTYWEHDNIIELERRLREALDGISWELTIVDDDSRDGTAHAVRNWARRNPRVRCLQRIGRRGLASACIEGMLASSADTILIMDADLQHDEKQIPRMLEEIRSGDTDIVIASRYIPGSSMHMSTGRKQLSRFATFLSRLICHQEIFDPMSGFFVLRRSVLESTVRTLSARGFKILFDIISSSPRRLKIKEIPFEFRKRNFGKSKMDFKVAWEFGLMVMSKMCAHLLKRLFNSSQEEETRRLENTRQSPTAQGGPLVRLLAWTFFAVLLLRVVYPFVLSPMEHLYSDPQRHWENGKNFFTPNLMGANDPFLYQVWIAVLRYLTGDKKLWVDLACGMLCALMPYGWYKTLRELLPKTWALTGAIVIGLWPEGFAIYSYFMNETLLLTLTGWAFWSTLRAGRKGDSVSFALTCILWMCAMFTRTIAAPLALLSLGVLWLVQPKKLRHFLIGLATVSALAIPAAWHSHLVLGFMAPLGNLYMNEIYAASGNSSISVNVGPAGTYFFTSPSFANPTFYPFSNWISDRSGVFHIQVDLTRGRRDWQQEIVRAEASRTISHWQQRWEEIIYLLFAQSWPDNDKNTISGMLAVWSRWLWVPIVGVSFWGVWRRRFHAWEWLLPACGLGTFLLLALQSEDAMEGRFRKPVGPILIAALVVQTYRTRTSRQQSHDKRAHNSPPPSSFSAEGGWDGVA